MSPQMFSRFPGLLPVAAILVALLPAAAHADSADATIVNLVTKQLIVKSNGSSYTQAPLLGNLIADIRVEADAGVSGKVKDWKTWLLLQTESMQTLDFSNFAYTKTYPWNERPKSVDRIVQVAVPKSAWEHFVVLRCNKVADDLRAMGQSDTVIFGEDRSFELAVIPRLEVEMSGVDNLFADLEQATAWSQFEKVEVVCQKWSGAAIPQVTTDLTTESATVVNHGLSIYEQSTLAGTCKIRLDGWLTTDHKGASVSFRYKSDDGKTSQLHSVNTGDSKTATFSHWYDVPNNPDGPENGHVWMEGVSHDFQSEIAGYSLNCIAGGPDGLVSNDPPKLTMTILEEGKVMVHGRLCPEKLQLVGVLEGRGNFSGQALFHGPGYLSPLRDYSITHGQKVLIGAEVVLDWDSVEVPPAAHLPLAQAREFGLNVTNGNNVVIASIPKRLFAAECFPPVIAPGVQLNNDLKVGASNPAATTEAPAALKAPRRAPARLLKVQPVPSSQPAPSLRQRLIEERRLRKQRQ